MAQRHYLANVFSPLPFSLVFSFTMSRVAKHQNQKWYLKTNQIYVIHALDKESKAQLAGARAGI